MSRTRNLARIQRIVIHHTATPNGEFVRGEDIDAWHAWRGNQRDPAAIDGWEPRLPHIGYHFIVYDTGSRVGRRLTEIGEVAGRPDYTGIGIVLPGTDKFCHGVWQTLAKLINSLQNKFNRTLKVSGHGELIAGADCPGFSVADWLSGGMTPAPAHVWSGA